MNNNNPRGSLWNKWDLHVHTPDSIVHNYAGESEKAWEKFISDLENLPESYKVLGINDYIFIDGYERLLKAKHAGRLKNIDLLLPVIELRVDKFAGVVKKAKDGDYQKSDWNRINIHVIFDELDPEIIRQQFLNALVPSYQLIPDAQHLKGKWKAVITRPSLTQLGEIIISSVPEEKRGDFYGPLQEGFNNLCCNLDGILEALQKHDLRGHHITAVGKTEWANMKWDDQSIAEKKSIINRVDIVFTAAENEAAYRAAHDQLKKSNVNATLFDCSDAHNFSGSEDKDRIGNSLTWVKADTTFQGLRLAIMEFGQRVYVGDVPPKLTLVENNKTKFIDSIEVRKKTGSALSEKWFDVEVPLNKDLVAIIGNKGSGKSALTDIAALVGNTRNFKYFSFLTDKRFRDPRTKLAKHFSGSLRWDDGTSISRELDENPPEASVERIKYLPQNYLESLCNELSVGGSTTFDKELRKIIYTHVSEPDRLGYASLDELLAFKVSELQVKRDQLAAGIARLNGEIVELERKLSPAFRATLEQQLEAKQNELSAIDLTKPTPAPEAEETGSEESSGDAVRLAELEAILKALEEEETLARQVKSSSTRKLAHVAKIKQALSNYQNSHKAFQSELDGMLAELGSGIRASELTNLSIDSSKIDVIAVEQRAVVLAQDQKLSAELDGGILRRRSIANDEVAKIKNRLGDKQRKLLIYKQQLAEWDKRKSEIIGDEGKVGSITWLRAEINNLAGLPEKLEEKRSARIDAVRGAHRQIKLIADEYRAMYAPVQEFVNRSVGMEMSLPLRFNVHVAENGFQEQFLTRLNRQAKGSFSGVEESNQLMQQLIQEADFSSEDAVIAFLTKIDDMLHFDRRPENKSVELTVSSQLRRSVTVEDLYDYLYSIQYLTPEYSLTYNSQEISQLSPGERGLLLLVFYLLVDKEDIPLVIDQPEENLDNQTIYKVLVTCIKEAKERRQVIMVTHNPNLAVVCDAEQIIYAKCDKADSSFEYESGAIESPQMRARVLEILEGTQPAFDNRKLKYED